MMPSLNQSILASAIAAAMLTACGGDSTTPSSVSGSFLDAAVEGLDYVAGTAAKAITGADGEFTCYAGDKVAFSLGGINLGTAPCAAIVTPLNLAETIDVKNPQVVNRLLALQLLDEDGDPSNGIKITTEAKAAVGTRPLDFSATPAAFHAALNGMLASMPAKYQARSADDGRRAMASEHFQDTLASRVGSPVVETITQNNGLGAIRAAVTRYQIKAAAALHIPYEGSISAVKADFSNGFLPSYGSGLAFKGIAANGDLEFYGVTDRGPNGDGPNVPFSGATSGSKIFPSPSFVPSIGLITVGKGGAILRSSMPIKVSASINTSGLPIPVGSVGNSAEVPVTDTMRFNANSKATFDANGLDTESIVVDKKRNALWLSDEYGTFIVKVDPATGVIQNKYAPGSGLPTIFGKRRANRGMEGLALDTTTDKLHGFLQSPLADGNANYAVSGKSERIERFASFTRWIEFDPTSGSTTRMFAYPLDATQYQDGRTGNAKLGDMVALGNGKFIVIEQGSGPSGKVFNKLMLVEIGNASDISAQPYNPATSDLEKSSMAGAAVNGANWAMVTPLRKTLLLDLNDAGWLAEKAEGLTLVDGATLALVNDNDFGLITKVFDVNGVAVAGADVTACNVDANGGIITSSSTGCVAGNTIRVARGSDMERPARLWLIKFDKALSSFNIPAK